MFQMERSVINVIQTYKINEKNEKFEKFCNRCHKEISEKNVQPMKPKLFNQRDLQKYIYQTSSNRVI